MIDFLNRFLELFKVYWYFDAEYIIPKLIISDKDYKYLRLYCLDDLEGVFGRESEGLRVHNNRSKSPPKGHLDGHGGVIGYVDVTALVSQYSVEALGQNRVIRTQENFCHSGYYITIFMPS